MRHAYLIMAHNEFRLLQILLSCLDDPRNDIFVHIDKKVKNLPNLITHQAGLFILTERIDVRWGDISVMVAELSLFEAALQKGSYQYYHLLSGVDLPLKSQDYIHQFFEINKGKEFVGFTNTTITPEIVRKVQRWHPFPRSFKSPSLFIRGTRFLAIRFQELFGIKRNRGIPFEKGPQWVSITEEFVRYVIENKSSMLNVLSHTYCCDEMVIQTLLWGSPFKENIYDTVNEGVGCMRAIGWVDGHLNDWGPDDLQFLLSSPALFARKFNMKDPAFIEKIASLSFNNRCCADV